MLPPCRVGVSLSAPRLPGPMALHRLCLTLLACSGCWAQEVRVSQPGSVQAPEGGSVTLPCRYNSSRPAALGSYRWVKEEAGARLEVSDATLQFRGRVNGTPSRSFLQDRRADVRLRDLRPYDAGTYRCRVKIPTVGEGEGNGTRLLVVKAATPSVPPDSPALGTLALWLGTAVGVAFGVAVLLWICRKRSKDRRDAQPRTEALVQTAGPELNYAELRVKPGRRPMPGGEFVTYATVRGSGRS